MAVDLLMNCGPAFDAAPGRRCRLQAVAASGRFISVELGFRFEMLDTLPATPETTSSNVSCLFSRRVDYDCSPGKSFGLYATEEFGSVPALFTNDHMCYLHPNFEENGKCNLGLRNGWTSSLPVARIWMCAFCIWLLLAPSAIVVASLRACSSGSSSGVLSKCSVLMQSRLAKFATRTRLRIALLECLLGAQHFSIFVLVCLVYSKRGALSAFADDAWDWDASAGLFTWNGTADVGQLSVE